MSEDGEIGYFDINLILLALNEMLERYFKIIHTEKPHGLSGRNLKELQHLIKKVSKWKDDYKNNVENPARDAG